MRENHNKRSISKLIPLLILIIISPNYTTSQSIVSSETPQLGWGVILLIILLTISFILIIFGFCIDKPVIFITIGLIIPVLVFIILKVWPKEQISANNISLGETDSEKIFSVYDMYKTTKNYRVNIRLYFD